MRPNNISPTFNYILEHVLTWQLPQNIEQMVMDMVSVSKMRTLTSQD